MPWKYGLPGSHAHPLAECIVAASTLPAAWALCATPAIPHQRLAALGNASGYVHGVGALQEVRRGVDDVEWDASQVHAVVGCVGLETLAKATATRSMPWA